MFGRGQAKLRDSLFYDTFYFNRLWFRNHKCGGGGGGAVKALFMTNSEVNVSRPCLMQHTSQCYTNSLKSMFSFVFHWGVEVAEVLPMGLSGQYKSFLKTGFSYLSCSTDKNL